MADLWLNDRELFLYCKGNARGFIPHTLRCKKVTSQVPLKRSDFTEEKRVFGPHSLVGQNFNWSPANYDALIDYITSRRFLVNCEGLVFHAIFKIEEDGKLNVNAEVYLRSLDVLNLGSYGLIAPEVPFRSVEYLGKAAPEAAADSSSTNPPPNVTVIDKLIAELVTLTNEVATMASTHQAKIDAFEGRVANLEADKATLSMDLAKVTGEVASLRQDLNKEISKNHDVAKKIANLEGEKAKLGADVTNITNEVATLAQQGRADKEEFNRKLAGLEIDKVKLYTELATVTRDLNKQKSDMDDVKRSLANIQVKVNEIDAIQPPWMNNFSAGHWRSYDNLESHTYGVGLWIISPKSQSDFGDDNTTNVRPEYFYKATYANDGGKYKVIKLDELNSRKERARFDPIWHYGVISPGMKIVFRL